MSTTQPEVDVSMQADQGESRDNQSELKENELKLAQSAKDNQEEWIDHCRELVAEYRRLLQNSKSSYYKKDGDVGYLLSMKWLDHWKKCNYYDSLYRNLVPDFDEDKPTEIGEISNESLLRAKEEFINDVDPNSYYNYILRRDLKMNYDYKPVDEDTWNFFHSRYGGTTVKRFYYKSYSFGADIEAKLKEFKIVVLPSAENWDISNVSKSMSIFSSKHDTFEAFLARIVENLNSDQYGYKLCKDKIRPWKLAFNGSIERIVKEVKQNLDSRPTPVDPEEPDTGDDEEEKTQENTGIKFPGPCLDSMKTFTMDDLELSSNDTLVIEVASEKTGKFIFKYEKIVILCYGKCEYCYSNKPLICQCRCEEVKYCSDECLKKDERFHMDKCNAPIDIDHDAPFQKKDRARNGLTGLQNLGNTCFMNSSIQCLSNTYILTKFFLTEKFKEDINTDNVLGTGGKLAIQFARLMNEMWNDEAPVVTPWSFKKIVGSFQPMFSGFAQHDSAELLSFVLDGLHEDMNRVKKKPYFEMPDLLPGTAEQKCAELAWKYHLLRNQSIIVDIMQAQYKSTLTCPNCANISVTYDPYMMLSLPIPQNEVYTGLYYYLPYDSKVCPTKSRFYLKKSNTIIDLRKQIAEQLNIDPWSFVLLTIENKSLDRIFCKNRTIGELSEQDGGVFACQIDPDVFENCKEPEVYKKLNHYINSSDYALDIANDDDDNNSISRDWVKIPLRLSIMEKHKYAYYSKKKAVSFPRLIWINRNWDMVTVHKKVFNYLRFYFDFELVEGFKDLSEEQAFVSIFDGLTEENWEDKLGSGDDPGEFSYSLQVVNTESRSYFNKGLDFFGKNNFDNIPLPYRSTGDKFGEYIDQFFKESQEKDKDSDDDMDYGYYGSKKEDKSNSEDQAPQVINNFNDGYYEEGGYRGQSNRRKTFEFEIFWNKDNLQAAIQKLDRCKKHEDFTAITYQANQCSSEDITLRSCFESFLTPEKLGKDNAWYCRKCKDHVEATKKMELYSCPNILFVSLKRFKSGRGSYFKDKLEDKVLFPIEELDISDIILSNKNADGTKKQDIKYELYAVSNHYGNMGFGHYTAYAKNPLDNTWYDFDDSSVTEMNNPSQIVSEAGYNLFYKRTDFSFEGEVDFEAVKNVCDFEEFKLEVSHYQVPKKEKPEETKDAGDQDMEVS
ncbi:unnamed protein product [Moneuplotes crassus]|uniref:ubiquitinyl hydrolase 1 n=3 Tax=Euplotes crassus TaxID=5936 RepID=A0AAD1XID4_EUPCR|nr:unnamed protein product [Moneuplotes crassus]